MNDMYTLLMFLFVFWSTVICAVRTTEVKRNLENMWELYMKEVSPTVMCALRTT